MIEQPLAFRPKYLRCAPQCIVVLFEEGCESGIGQEFLSLLFPSGRHIDDERRWNIELHLRHIEKTLGLEALSCKTPAMCEKELSTCSPTI